MKRIYPCILDPTQSIEVWFCDEPCCRGKKFHREDGPAITYSDGAVEWWLHGRRLSEAEIGDLRKEIIAREIDEGLPHAVPVLRSIRFTIGNGAAPESGSDGRQENDK
jgi:hypothetical protein